MRAAIYSCMHDIELLIAVYSSCITDQLGEPIKVAHVICYNYIIAITDHIA